MIFEPDYGLFSAPSFVSSSHKSSADCSSLNEKNANVWTGKVEEAFQEALLLFPVSQGRQKLKSETDGKFYGEF